MLGSTAVMKAAKKGYKRYGIPGAVVAGLGTLIGIRFIKRKLSSRSQGSDDRNEGAGESDTTN